MLWRRRAAPRLRCTTTHEQVVQQDGVRTGHACHAHALPDEQRQEHPVAGEHHLAEQASGCQHLAGHDGGTPADPVGDDSRRQLRKSADRVEQCLQQGHLPGGEAPLLKEEDEYAALEQRVGEHGVHVERARDASCRTVDRSRPAEGLRGSGHAADSLTTPVVIGVGPPPPTGTELPASMLHREFRDRWLSVTSRKGAPRPATVRLGVRAVHEAELTVTGAEAGSRLPRPRQVCGAGWCGGRPPPRRRTAGRHLVLRSRRERA